MSGSLLSNDIILDNFPIMVITKRLKYCEPNLIAMALLKDEYIDCELPRIVRKFGNN